MLTSRKTFTGTPRHNLWLAIWASFSSVKLTHQVNDHNGHPAVDTSTGHAEPRQEPEAHCVARKYSGQHMDGDHFSLALKHLTSPWGQTPPSRSGGERALERGENHPLRALTVTVGQDWVNWERAVKPGSLELLSQASRGGNIEHDEINWKKKKRKTLHRSLGHLKSREKMLNLLHARLVQGLWGSQSSTWWAKPESWAIDAKPLLFTAAGNAQLGKGAFVCACPAILLLCLISWNVLFVYSFLHSKPWSGIWSNERVTRTKIVRL